MSNTQEIRNARKILIIELFEVITDEKLLKALKTFNGLKAQGFSNNKALAISMAFVVNKTEPPERDLTEKNFEDTGKKQKKTKFQPKEKRHMKR